MAGISSLSVATGHLNASVGPVLDIGTLAAALRLGSAHEAGASPDAAALISTLFVELTPDLILRCAAEANSDVFAANALYQEALEDRLPPVPEWERAIQNFL